MKLLQPLGRWGRQVCSGKLAELGKGASEATGRAQRLPSQVGCCCDYGDGVPAGHQPRLTGKLHHLDCPGHQFLLVLHKLAWDIGSVWE